MSRVCEEGECDRQVLAKGLCGKHYKRRQYAEGRAKAVPSTPEQNAAQTLRRGGMIRPPKSLPYRMLARTCPKCGTLLTTPEHLIRRKAGNLPRCQGCSIRSALRVRKARASRDPVFAASLRSHAQANLERVQAASVPLAVRSHQEWTGAELELAARRDLSARQVASMLNRTFYAVKKIRGKINAEDPRTLALLHGGEL